MPGAQHFNMTRQGASSELLAEFILNRIAFTARVPRQEDVGHDFICSLAEREGIMAKAGLSFAVQVKSNRKSISFTKSYEIKWLESQENPLFVCVVNRDALCIELFSTWNILNGLLKEGRPKVELCPGSSEEPTLAITRTETTMTIPLGKPVLKISAQQMMDDKAAERARRVLGDWIELDRQNIINRKAAMYWVKGPKEYETDAGLPENTEYQVSFYWNPKNLYDCLRNFGRTATALRTVHYACRKHDCSTPISELQLSALEEVLGQFRGFLDPLALKVLREDVGMTID